MRNSQAARISSSKDLGVVLARARKERGLSQREVAAQLSVTQKWVSAIEQGKSRAWIDKVLELAYFLDVQIHATTANSKPPRHGVVSNGDESTPAPSDAPGIDDLLGNES